MPVSVEVCVADIEEGSKSRATYRAALAAVIILSVLLAAAIVGVAMGFVRQYRLLHPGRTPGAVSAGTVQLPPGAHIVSSSTEAGKLVLHVTTPSGSEVDIFDLASGQRIQQIKDGAP
jgi:hypothetical protein